MQHKINYDPSIKFFVGVIGVAVITLILKELSNIFIPFVIAYILFFFFSPLNEFLSKRKFPNGIIILIDIVITAIVIWGIFKIIISSLLLFAEGLPQYITKLDGIIVNALQSMGINSSTITDFSIQNIFSNIEFSKIAGSLFQSTLSFLGTVFFILFFFVFIVPGHKVIYEAIKKRYLKSGSTELNEKSLNSSALENESTAAVKLLEEVKNIKEEKLAFTFKSINGQIQKYIITKVGLNLACGIAVSILLSMFGIDFPIVWGVFTFLFNFIPTIGSAAALLLPVLMALVQFESFGFALIIAGAMGGVQTLFFNLFEPSIIGRKLNLNPLLILISLLVWGYIWGIVGMLLSVPLTAIIKIILDNSDSENLKFISNLMSNE